ncbi:MAG: hypothetical protein JWQ07_40 [Ramlibacter sp.]|nr:hypothetical protein [Ramlibacter sp.]
MSSFRTVLAVSMLCALVACGGGQVETGQTAPPLASAKPVVVPESSCASGGSDYLMVNGECHTAFAGFAPIPAQTPALAAPSAHSSALAAPKGAEALASLSVNAFFDWAGPSLPQYFGYYYYQDSIYVGGYGTFTYRYYYGTGNYLGVLNGYVYVYGPATYYQMLAVAELSSFYCSVYSCYTRTFTSWTGSVNGVVVKDAGNESFAFYSDTHCLYSYARNQETTNFCLTSGASGYFAGQPVIVMSAANVNGIGCLAVLADTYGRQIDIYTDAYGTQIVQVLSTYWNRGSC